MLDTVSRCPWARQSEIEKEYHDNFWGRPLHDEQELFKLLCLEGMQAGLSWETILRKKEALCRAFDDFDPHCMAAYDDAKLAALLQDAGIIRNRLKIKAMRDNARAYFRLCEKHGSLEQFLWRYVDFKAIRNHWENMAEVPAQTALSERISKELKALGFNFVGPTIIYAFMQAAGLVNDHLAACAFRDAGTAFANA